MMTTRRNVRSMLEYKKGGTMDIAEELIKIEVGKMLTEKMKKYMTKIIDDFNEEKYGLEIEEIKMENVHYIVSINDKKIIL